MSEPTPIKFDSKPIERNDRSHRVDRTRPEEPPKSNKDFKRIMQSKDKEDGEIDPDTTGKEVVDEAAADGTLAEKMPSSLFELSAKRSPRFDRPIARKQPESHTSSNDAGDLAGALEVGKGTESDETAPVVESSDRAGVDPKEDASKRTAAKRGFDEETGGQAGSSMSDSGKGQDTTRFATAQSDISYINPQANIIVPHVNPIAIEAVKGEKPVVHVSNIQDIINQIVEKANQMQFEGKTDTTITLKHPPILAGANLVVTSFDNARGEFNISFENLTQAGKNLLDMSANQESLLQALHDKGYAVHILTTTTTTEHLVIDTPQPSGRDQGERNQQPGQQQQKRNKEQEG